MYIEINLLPQGFRPKRTLIKFDYKFVLTLVIVLGAIGIGGYFYLLKKNVKSLQSQIAFYRAEEVKIKGTIALDNEVKALRKSVEERVEIIKELTGESDVRFLMLDHVNRSVPENLWLMSISEVEEDGKTSVRIEGMSYSKDNISEFLAGLEKCEQFSNVALESIKPAPLEVRDAFNYIVKVDLKSSKPPPAEEDPRAARRARRRR